MIRPANERDIAQLINLGHMMHEESRHYWRALDDDAVETFVLTMLNSSNMFLWVAEREGRVTGFFAGLLAGVWYSTARLAQDVCLYVEPASRGSLDGVRLINRFIEWGREHGADEIIIENDAAVPNSPIGMVLTRMGMDRVGEIYSMRARK